MAEQSINLDDVFRALSEWGQQEAELRTKVRTLQATIDELTQQRQRGIERLRRDMGLPDRPGSTFDIAIDEAVRTYEARVNESRDAAELLQGDVISLRTQVETMIEERNQAIARLVETLEKPVNRNRTLSNAVTEAVEMIQEAKKMVQENL